jgi:flagellar hook-associated protein 3 FlgL
MISGTRYRLTAEINRQVNLAREIARTQVEIATGKRIQTPSDDPTGSALVSDLARAQAQEAAWMRNLDVAGTLSDRADNALKAVAANVDRANELMVAAANQTLSAENRATIALELRAIAVDIGALADSRDPRGGELFRTDAALEIPVGAGGNLAAVGSRAEVFGNIATAGGPLDLVTIINNAAAAIVEPDPALRRTATDASLAAVAAANDHVAAVRADQGVRGSRIDRLREEFEQSALLLDEQRGAIEGVDLTEAIARLQSKQLSLQAAQAVLARVSQSSLFDQLR